MSVNSRRLAALAALMTVANASSANDDVTSSSFERVSYSLLGHAKHFDPEEELRCDRMAERLAGREAKVAKLEAKDHIGGMWVSSECEVRPGPEFLLRQYHFSPSDNGSFHLRQFRYADRHCRQPLYSVSAWGRLRGLDRPSWLVPGAVEADAVVHKVAVVPYTKDAARKLERSALLACPRLLSMLVSTHSTSWVPYEERPVYIFHEGGAADPHSHFNADVSKMPSKADDLSLTDLDCLQHLHMDFHELQLIRLELRPASVPGSRHGEQHHRTELLLGDVHTRKDQRRHYRPTAFQPHSLLKAAKAHHSCTTCHKVMRASSSTPPLLPIRPHLTVAPEGEWLSRRCETRPNTLFLTRRLSFFNDRTWQGLYEYYKDEHCTKKIFSIVAKGRYIQGDISKFVDGGTEYEFKIKQAIITAHTSLLAHQLNISTAGTCGRRGDWQAHVPMDVTPTGGCAGIGLKVPLLEHDLLKMSATRGHGSGGGGRLLLYLGQTETDPKHIWKRRPTSYQPPLVQCHSNPGYHIVTNELFPMEMAALTARASAAAESMRMRTSTCSSLLIAMLLSHFARGG